MEDPKHQSNSDDAASIGLEPGKCDEFNRLAREFDIDGMTAHLTKICWACRLNKLEKSAPAVVKLFYSDNAAPKSVDELIEELEKEEEEEVDDEEEPEENEEEEGEGPEAKRPRRIAKVKENRKVIIGEENIAEHLEKMNYDKAFSDGMLEYEIRRLKNISEEDARAEVIKMRKQKKEELKKKWDEEKAKTTGDEEENEEQPKEKKEIAAPPPNTIRPPNLPWMPLIHEVFPSTERSVLNNEEQKRVVAIIVNVFNTNAFRFVANKEDLKIADKKLMEEREKLDQMVIEKFANNIEPKVPPHTKHYMEARWGMKWETVSDLRFQTKPVLTLPWGSTPDTPTNFSIPEVSCTLNEGKSNIVRMPNVEVKQQLDTFMTKAKCDPRYSNKVPIEEDESIMPFCTEMNVSVAMDACTATYLMTNSFLGKPEDVCFAITVQTKLTGGVFRKIICISKPKIHGKQRSMAFIRSYAKHTFNANCVEKRRRDLKEVRTKLSELEGKKLEKKQENVIEKQTEAGPEEANDPLSNIFSQINSTVSSSTPQQSGPKTGKRYTVFKFGAQSALIRSSTPLQCESNKAQLNGLPVTVQPVIELAPFAGATRLDPEELLFNHCKMVFKQAETHAFVRIGLDFDYKNKRQLLQVLQVHSLFHFTDTVSADIERQMKNTLRYRTERMQTLLASLDTLENGIYLMRDTGSNLVISAQDTNGSGSGFSCKDKHKRIHYGLSTPPFEEIFQGIDHRMMLQWQIYQNRAPGAFVASDCPVAKQLEKYSEKKGSTGLTKGQKRRQRKATMAKATKGKTGKETANKESGDEGPSDSSVMYSPNRMEE